MSIGIFEAGNTFSKAHHFWYPFVNFRGCELNDTSTILENCEVGPKTSYK